MMVTLGIYVRRGQRWLRRLLQDATFHAAAETLGYLAGGFFLSAASLGSHPQCFTLGLLCALSGWPAVLLAAGGMLGYFVFWGGSGTLGVLWLCAGLIAAIILGGRPILQRMPLLMPAISGVIAAAGGVVYGLWTKTYAPFLIYCLQVAMALGSAVLFSIAQRRREAVTDWLLTGVAVLALAQVIPIPYLGFGYIAAGFFAVSSAFPAAALSGLALDLAQITPVPMTGVLCLSYLGRLIPRLPKKFLVLFPAAACLILMPLRGVWDLQPVPGLFLGACLHLILPGNTEVSRRRGETGFAQVRLELASGVLNQTRLLLQDVEEAPIDEAALIERAAERACGSCPCKKGCHANAKGLSTDFLRKPLGNGESLPIQCKKTGRLLQELRRSQEQLRSIRADRDRQLEYRSAVVQQYRFLSDYLQDLSDTLAQRTRPAQAYFQPELAVCSASREKANGDRCLWFAGVECKYYILLCDGMGTGPQAALDGKMAASMLKKLLTAGYPAQYALRSLNSLCALQGRAGAVTVDLAELHLDTGRVILYKWGAAPSFVVSRSDAIKIGTAAPPPGLSVSDGRETVERLSLRKGEMLVLLSDGAGGEDALTRALEEHHLPPGELAARILECSGQDRQDDATVAVVRLGCCTPES